MKLIETTLLCLISQVSATSVSWWQTTEATTDRLTEKLPLTLGEASAAQVVVSVNISQTFQTILGFGGALTQSSATVFKLLPLELQGELMDSYYGPDGIQYSTGRLPIHSCDFSVDTYTFDDSAGDFELDQFDTSIAYDTNLSIPFVKAALERNADLKLFGSPWSPPAWMKSNQNMLSGGSLLENASASWALYFSKWISSYDAHGVSVWGVTPQNEPEAAQPWESCVYSAEEEAAFVGNYLGPQLKVDWPEVKILGYDHNKDHISEWAAALLGPDSPSKGFVDGVAFHWYSGNCFENVASVAEAYPDKILLPTEACYELTQMADDEAGDAWLANGTWARGEGYGHDILGDLNAGSAGWTDWNIILDQDGGPNHVNNFCDAPVLADLRTDAPVLHYHPQYWYLGHFSKFIAPGSVRVATTVETTARKSPAEDADCQGWPAYGTCDDLGGLQATSFLRPDHQLAVVLMNCGDDEVSDVAITITDGSTVSTSIPGHSIQTYVFPATE